MDTYVGGDSETFGRGDGGVGDPRRTCLVPSDAVEAEAESNSVGRFRATIWN